MHFPRRSVLSSSSSPKKPSSSPKSPSSSRNRRLTRAKPLRYPRECDVNPLNSPHRHADSFFRFSSPPSPHPLPLPDKSPLISAVDDNQISNSKSKCVGYSSFRLPSPTQVSKERESPFYSKPYVSTVMLQDGQRNVDAQRRANAQQGVDARVLARHSRHSSNYAETCSSWTTSKSMQGTRRTQQHLSIDITFRSAPTSLNSSPLRSPQTLFPLESPHWSEPAISTGLKYAGFPESTKASCDASPCKSPLLKSPKPPRKSFSGPPSPLHPTLSVETSSPHHDGNFLVNGHPLPLPPTPSSVAASPVPQVMTTPEFLPFKNQWTKGKPIGCGSFGSVFVASNRETGALCAMKEVQICPDDPKSTECMKQLEQEIKVLSQLKHPNIVQYYGSEIVDDKFYIYLEYVYPGSINKYIHEHCGAITEAVVRNFTRHILSGLAYLHSRKTIHRDIKGANLLVDASGVVKLADFGMAKHLTGQADVLSLKGSPYWMAPELMQAVIQKDKNSDLAFVVDIWSLGCTIIEMLTGKPPWNEFEGAAAMFKVLKESPPIPETLSSEGKDFLHCCFQRNPADRPPANKLLDHPFLKTYQQLDFPSSRLAPNLMI